MKKLIVSILCAAVLCMSTAAHAEPRCIVIWENATNQVACPNGGVIESISFANFGRANGTCQANGTSNFSLNFQDCPGAASTSNQIVTNNCHGQPSCVLTANIGTFGDPCPGTFKNLSIAYNCGGSVGPTPTFGPNFTPTFNPGTTPTFGPSPTPGQSGASIEMNRVTAQPGETVQFSAILHNDGSGPGIVATENEVHYNSPRVQVVAQQEFRCQRDPTATCNTDDNCGDVGPCVQVPECHVNDRIHKSDSRFEFRPRGCFGDACTGIKALVFSFSEVNVVIDDGATLYTCDVFVPPDTPPGNYALNVGDVMMAFPPHGKVANPGHIDGAINVRFPPTATPTRTPIPPTPTATPSPTSTPCVGSCDGSGPVDVADLIAMINILLADGPASDCPAGDADGNGRIELYEIIWAIDNSLDGC